MVLGDKLHGAGLKLMIDLPLINETNQKQFPQNYGELNQISQVDYLLIMAYDYQYVKRFVNPRANRVQHQELQMTGWSQASNTPWQRSLILAGSKLGSLSIVYRVEKAEPRLTLTAPSTLLALKPWDSTMPL